MIHMNKKPEKKRYTKIQLWNMVRKGKNVPFYIRNSASAFIDGIEHAVFTIQLHPETDLTMMDTHGDYFCEGYNWLVTKYQRYKNDEDHIKGDGDEFRA